MKYVVAALFSVGLCHAPPALAQYFGGYECTIDCSGHEAGYEWAEQNGVLSTYDCSGNSSSFIEGCLAYVEEQDSGYSGYDEDYGDDEEADEENW